jgi:hypothetical protein
MRSGPRMWTERVLIQSHHNQPHATLLHQLGDAGGDMEDCSRGFRKVDWAENREPSTSPSRQ